MKLSAAHNKLRQKAISELIKIVEANKKPIPLLEGKEGISFNIQGARFLTVKDGELKPINSMRYYVDINSILLLELINFIESFEKHSDG